MSAPPLSTQEPNPFAATGLDERQHAYAALAADGPVRRIALPDGAAAWLVLGADEARSALTDARLEKTTHTAGQLALRHGPEAYGAVRNHLLLRDGAPHARLRRLVGGAFTARRMRALAPRIRAIAEELLDSFGDAQQIDLLPTYALPLPMTVICELIGVPEALRGPLRESTQPMIAGVFADPDTYLTAIHTHASIARELVALKRRSPSDDLLSALVAARDGGDRLSEDELTSMLSLLVVAGHETTTHLIGNAVHLLLTHPDQLALVRADPGRMPAAVEEALRLEGPVHVTLPLRATAPVDLGGKRICPGEVVLVALLTANRALAPEATRFDVQREHLPHIAFGYGIHHCLGAPLARLEAQIALASLLTRYPDLAIAAPPGALRRHPNMLIHGLKMLPVRLH